MLLFSVPADDKEWVYCAGLRHAAEAEWDLAFARLQVYHIYVDTLY